LISKFHIFSLNPKIVYKNIIAQLKENSGRGQTAVSVLTIFFGLTIIALVSKIMKYNLHVRMDRGDFTMDEATSNELRSLVIGIVFMIVKILTAIFFIMWFRRAYYNLTQIPNSKVNYTEGWAAGAWFVPILNLFRPVEIMNEIWRETQIHSGNTEEAQKGS